MSLMTSTTVNISNSTHPQSRPYHLWLHPCRRHHLQTSSTLWLNSRCQFLNTINTLSIIQFSYCLLSDYRRQLSVYCQYLAYYISQRLMLLLSAGKLTGATHIQESLDTIPQCQCSYFIYQFINELVRFPGVK